jgi:integrase
MATVKKLRYTRYVLPDPSDVKKLLYVNAKTPGAKKITEEGTTYFVVWKEGGKTKREATGLTDKTAAQAYLSNWHKARERGQVGVTDPYKNHLDRPITEHVDEYLKTLTGRSDQYQREVKRVLGIIIKATKAQTLRDMTTERIRSYLDGMSAGRVTRALHRSYVGGLFSWLAMNDRVPVNIIDRVPVPSENDKDRKKLPRQRRAYTVSELRQLLTAAREYPLWSRTRATGGRPKKDGTPATRQKPVRELKPDYVAQLTRDGKERELVYRLHIATGLRRGELSRVTVEMFKDGRLTVPKTILKVKPKHIDYFVFLLPSTLANDLSTLLSTAPRKPGERLLNVPIRRNYLREHQKRLKFGKIEYKTERGHADIHAFRMTGNKILKRKDVPLDQRQRYLRHTARDMTSARYDPDTKTEVVQSKKVMKVLTRLDRVITSPAPQTN